MTIFSQVDTRQIPVYSYSTPTTGSTVTLASVGYNRAVFDPAGSLLAFTVTFPSIPQEGDVVELSFSQTITTLTMNGGTILSALTTAVAGSKGTWVYSGTSTKWHLLG